MSDTSVAGTDTLVFLAEGEPGWDFPSGEFFIGRRVAKLNKQAFDAKLAKDLWERSERMIALTEGLNPKVCKRLAERDKGLRELAAACS